MTRPPVATYGLTHLALATRDVEHAFEFYEKVFGMVAVYRDRAFLQAQTPGTGDVLVFERAEVTCSDSAGVAHVGFRLKNPDAIQDAAELVEAAGGVVVERGEFVPGEPYLFARDRDGYMIEIWFEIPTSADHGISDDSADPNA